MFVFETQIFKDNASQKILSVLKQLQINNNLQALSFFNFQVFLEKIFISRFFYFTSLKSFISQGQKIIIKPAHKNGAIIPS